MTPIAARGLALLLTSPAFAAWSPPDPAQLARLERVLAPLHEQYNPAEQMIRRPYSSPGYHTTLTGGFVHPTRDALHYALAILDTGNPGYLERAAAILRRVIALQDTNPENRTYGIWSWFLEEPLARMNPPGWNWADFNGMTLLQVARDHRSRLPADLMRQVDASIQHAARSIRKRNVGPGYTNIAILGTYVTYAAAELYDDTDLLAYARERLQRLYQHTEDNGGAFEEYNSPTYTTIALLELSRLQAHVRDPAAQPMIARLLRHAWEEIAGHFHAPTRQWAGPNSRAYGSLIRTSTLALIQRGTSARVDFGVDAPDREELRVPLACPADLEPLFLTLAAPRTVTKAFVKRTGVIGTTYLHPEFALGSVNRADLWNQRRPLLLHFGTAEQPGYLQLRFLKDGYDFAAAQFVSAQHDGHVVAAVTFATNGGDRHVSLDRLKDGRFRARDLRLRFELGGPAARAVSARTEGDRTMRIAAGKVAPVITVARARFGELQGRLTSGNEAENAWVDVVFHEGAERAFDLAAMDEAVIGFALTVGAPAPLRQRQEGAKIRLESDGLVVEASVKPAPRR